MSHKDRARQDLADLGRVVGKVRLIGNHLIADAGQVGDR